MSQQPQPVVSPDGRWWWDGHTWRPTYAVSAPAPNQPPPGTPPRRRRKKTLYVVVGIIGAIALLLGAGIGTAGWLLTRGTPSALESIRVGLHSSIDWPYASSFDLTEVDGQQTMVFAVHVPPAAGTDAPSLLPKAQALQAIVNRYAPDYEGQVLIRFRQHHQVLTTVAFHAHDTITVSSFPGQ